MRGLPWWTTLTNSRNSLRLNPYLFSSTSLHPHPSQGTGRAVSGRAWARVGKWSPAARHPKFGIPVGGFLHRIVFLGVPRDVLILVSRSLLCSGSCPFSDQKHFFFNKSADRRFALDPATFHPKKKVCLKNRRIVALGGSSQGGSSHGGSSQGGSSHDECVDAARRRVGCTRGISEVFSRVLGAEKCTEDATRTTFQKSEIGEIRGENQKFAKNVKIAKKSGDQTLTTIPSASVVGASRPILNVKSSENLQKTSIHKSKI